MRNSLLIHLGLKNLQGIGLTLFLVLSLSTFIPSSFAADSEVSDHIGEISQDALLQTYNDFHQEYESYSPTEEEVAKLSILAGKDVMVLFGTWCHDSEREVPRLLKLLALSDSTPASLTLFAVDRKKQDPEGVAAHYNLKYTPTIIVSSDGEELARIIEKPSSTLASDLALKIGN